MFWIDESPLFNDFNEILNFTKVQMFLIYLVNIGKVKNLYSCCREKMPFWFLCSGSSPFAILATARIEEEFASHLHGCICVWVAEFKKAFLICVVRLKQHLQLKLIENLMDLLYHSSTGTCNDIIINQLNWLIITTFSIE